MVTNILALDIGTQSTRAAVVGVDGEIADIAQIAHEVSSPHDGWAEQQPRMWWDEVCRAVRQVLEETGTAANSIVAVATVGQMHGPVGIDEHGEVTTEWVQLWCDKRCAEQVEAIRVAHDEDHLARLAGSPINPAWSGLKVRWHLDNQPEVYVRSRWFLVPKDFINYRLTGIAAADPSEASGSFLYDCERECYSMELAEAIGVDIEKFAPVLPSHAVIGSVTAAAAQATGLLEGTPVVAGGGDFPASMLGFGIVGEGVTADVTGTSTLLATHSTRPLIDPAIQNLRHVVDGWIPFTLLDCGGLSMKWCRDLVSSMRGEDVEYDTLIELAREATAGSDGLIFYPYMLGERRRENTVAKGGYIGIALNHAAPHFVRAVMEGVALTLGKDMETFRKLGHRVTSILSVGGGTRNELWNTIKASITRTPLEISTEPEAGLRGAALLGAAGAGLIDDPARAALERRSATTTVPPDEETYPVYEELQREFNRIYDHMLGFWGREGD